ncbi:MAG: protease family protein [Verrucomicrobiota bacterium]|jgi:membrane protease YdiL (CAAX protease family)
MDGLVPGNRRREAAFQLGVILAIKVALRAVLSWKPAQALLPALPVVERSWVWFLFALGLLWWVRRWHRAEAGEFGLRPFRPWWRLLLIALLGAIVAVVLGSLISPLTAAYFGKPELHRFSGIAHNLPLYLFLVPFAFVFAGFGEEFADRGVIMTRLALLFGSGKASWTAALIVQAILFGLDHFYQGTAGMVDVGIYGLVYGAIFLVARRNLWANALSHGLLDALAFTLLYLGVMKF